MELSFATSQLSMRLITAADLPLFSQLYGDPKTMRKIAPAFDQPQIEQTFDIALSRTQDPQLRDWMWVIEHQHKAIGLQSLTARTNLEHADAGIMILPSNQGKPFTMEASIAIVSFGFKQLNFSRIYAQFDATNLATKRILNRLNFTFIPHGTLTSEVKGEQKTLSCYLDKQNWHFPLPKLNTRC